MGGFWILDLGLRGRRRGQFVNGSIILLKSPGNGRLRERVKQENMMNVAQFSGIGTQKFTARRHIVEKVAHLDLGANRAAGILDENQFSAVDIQINSRRTSLLPREQPETGDGRDARNGFAAETESMDGPDVG